MRCPLSLSTTPDPPPALQQAIQQVAGAVGLAVLSTVALRHATTAAAAGTDVLVATTQGYVIAYQIGAVLLVVGAVLALTVVPGLRDREASTAEHEFA